MHFLRKGEKPKKKVSGSVDLGDGYVARYVATSAREHVMGYKDGELIASIYMSASFIKELDVEMDKIQVAGDYERFLPVVGVGVKEEDEIPHIEWDNTAKGNSNKVKGMEYEDYVDTSSQKNAIKSGIEDYLYTNVPLRVLQEENDLSWAERKNYRILIEDDEILEWIEGLKTTNEIVGFDTETSGLLTNRTKRDVLVGICMSYEDNTGVYFPLRHERYENVKMGEKRLLHLLRPYCDKNYKTAKKLVTHNGQFDWRVMKMFGWRLNIVYDTLIRQAIKEIASASRLRKLKDIARAVLHVDVVELEDMYEKRTKTDLKLIYDAIQSGASVNDITRFKFRHPVEKQNDVLDFRYASREFSELYGPADADFPRLIHQIMDKDWDESLDFIYRLEVALIPALGEQEYYGVKVDKEGIEGLYEDTKRKVMELETEIYQVAGRKFKISSPQQKVDVLFNDMKIPVKPRYKTKKGGISTDKNTMDDIAQYKNNDGSAKYPIVPLLQEYSKLSTLISNFYSKLPKLVIDGYLFPNYNSTRAETGRLTCSNPNVQQTEPQTRKYMIPETDEYYFLICDFSQVEYRLMAGLSGETKVVNFFRSNPEADYHIMAYANMMNKAYEDVTSKERKVGKVLNFGTSYGLEDANLALKLYGDDTPYHQKMAREARKRYFDGVPNLRDYFEDVRDRAEVTGYTETLFKRRRNIPEFQTFGKIPEYKRGSGRRKAGNMPVQGTAADIMKMAMYRIYMFFKKYGFNEEKVRMVLNVHDEVCVQVHKSINPWLATAIMREAMEIDFSAKGIPPLYVGANVGYCWKDGKVDELEAPVILMDEKCAWAMEKFKAGEELPVYDDPRTFWENQINEFAVRVIAEEIEKDGVKNLKEAHKNGRIIKYSHHFGDAAEAMIVEVLKRGKDAVYADLKNVVEFNSILAKKLLKACMKRINEKGHETKEQALKDSGLENALKYFGMFAGNVVEWLMETEGDVDAVLGNVRHAFANKKQVKPVGFTTVNKKKKKGEEVEEDFVSVEDKMKKMLRYSKKNNMFTLRMEKNDYELFSLLDSMLVPAVNKHLFKENTKFTNFTLVYDDGTEYFRSGELWVGNFLPILKDMILAHLTDGNYLGFRDRIDEVGSKLVATEEEVQAKEDNSISKITSAREAIAQQQRKRAAATR
ncbi:DNA polymerase [Bacillus sp. NEAU-Y102]